MGLLPAAQRKDQVVRQQSFTERKGFTVGQPRQETGGNAQICLPNWLLSGVFLLEVGGKRERGFGDDWWNVGISFSKCDFKSSLHRLDCPSCLVMGHMCKPCM